MQKSFKLTAIVLFLMAGFIIFQPHGIQANFRLTTSESKASPRSLYVQNCARCHGSNGKAQTAQGRKVEADDLTREEVKGISDAKMTRVITNGRGKMPGFGKRLTAAQIAQIGSYVRGL